MVKRLGKNIGALVILLLILLAILIGSFAGETGHYLMLGNIRVEFFLFALILVGVASFHHYTFYISVSGMLVILAFKFIFDPGFHLHEHLFGENSFIQQLADKDLRQGEWGILLNLFGLLLGFAILAKVFEESKVPDLIPYYLPKGLAGHFTLLAAIFVLSSFLDNIAAALIGGTIALVIYKNKVHIGFIAAIVAASNAGGSGSVIGDTTTTMMWIDGVSPLNVVHAFIAAGSALLIFGWFASYQQDKLQKIELKPTAEKVKVDYKKILLVFLIIVGAVVSNFLYDMPALGVWVVIMLGPLLTKIPWGELRHSILGSIFLLGLVFSASMMPVEELPLASWGTAFFLGFLSSVFDNIPLTKLCLEQGHYDWGMVAYSVGFGGSMIWFGSSAGVAITNKFPEARNMVQWAKNGWHVALAYVAGFFILLYTMGWEPADNREHKIINCPVKGCPFATKATTENRVLSHPGTYSISWNSALAGSGILK
jgi:Na+/H+ antiporter NhaD/arsenite permease-like protein